MSFSPESFDRLLADKLAQAPEPSYDPAHWDQLEDQLQHLNQALRQQPNGQAAPQHTPQMPVSPAAFAPLAKVGVVALLAGLTAVNGYFFFGARPAAAPASTTSAPLTVGTPSVIAAAPLMDDAAESPAAPLPTAEAPNPTAPARTTASAAPAVAAPRLTTAKAPNRALGTPVLVAAAPVATPTPALPTLVVPATVAQPAGSLVETASADNTPADRPDSSATRPANAENAAKRLAQDVPNVITPNGDGKNDRFELPLPIGTCRLTIYDQRNRLVFSSQQYDNTWDANGLPSGNYFYLVETVKPMAWRSSGKIEVVK